MPTIKLYLGAHKTASTYIQNLLFVNRVFLEGKGFSIFIPKTLRKLYLPQFFEYCKEGKVSKNLYDILLNSKENIIISDENLIGIPEDFIRVKGMYPYAVKRLKCFKKLYKDFDIKFYFSIRNYFEFYNSIYSEIIRNSEFLTIKEFKERLWWKDNSWVKLIEEISQIIGKENIFIWDFSLVKKDLFTILKLLVNINEKEFNLLKKDIKEKRLGLSLKSIEIMENIHSVLKVDEYFSLLERINNKYSVSKGFSKVNVFSNDEKKFLKNKYEKDIKSIEKILGKHFFN